MIATSHWDLWIELQFHLMQLYVVWIVAPAVFEYGILEYLVSSLRYFWHGMGDWHGILVGSKRVLFNGWIEEVCVLCIGGMYCSGF